MKIPLRKVWIRLLKVFVYGLVGSLITLTCVGIIILNRKPDLEVWHKAELDAEFTADSAVETFPEYLELEERLFDQLREQVSARLDTADENPINRFYRGSLSDPEAWPRNWNRSYELEVDGEPAAAVLLIHGLSDSPYSLHSIGARLHEAGAYVLGLRVPGHGTAPAALTRTSWQDMAAAVELAMRHLEGKARGRPHYIIGYSNGAALAVHYALSTLEDEALPSLAGMVLISPQIGVTPVAGLAIWQERIGRLLGLRKLAWKSVMPEYDPFKYGSFPINAGKVAHELTNANRAAMERLAEKLDQFPPVLGFQSVVDATVSASAVVHDLFAKLPAKGHEIVAFGLNRTVESEPLLKTDPMAGAQEILNQPGRSYVFTLLTNANPESVEVVEQRWSLGVGEPSERPLGLSWPPAVHSLSHVALPFRSDDPLYGKDRPDPLQRIHLGAVALRGERDVIYIPAGEMLRQRWNPFYDYVEGRILERLGLAR